MPNMIQAINKVTGQAENFIDMDVKICAMLGCRVHPTAWCAGWYDVIVTRLVIGSSFERINADLAADLAADPEDEVCQAIVKISAWLEENYKFEAWYAHK